MHRTSFATLVVLALLQTHGRVDGVRGDTIVLKPSVRLGDPSIEVRLADVATLEGPLAQAQADLVVATRRDADELVELSVEDVRRALDAAGVHWGKVHLSGRRSIVRPAPRNGAAPPRAMVTLSLDGGGTGPMPEPVEAMPLGRELVGEPTIRGALARHVVEQLGRASSEVRLRFDAEHETLLDTRLDGPVRCELEPASSLAGPRFEIVTRLWRDGLAVEQHAVGGRVEVLANVVVPRRELRRGDTVEAGDLRAQQLWLAPQVAEVAARPAEVAGRIARTKLTPEQHVRRTQVEAPVLIRRGDQVTARCLVGGLVITVKAEARADGAAGQTIECRKLGERETFHAVVAGPGEVVVDASR